MIAESVAFLVAQGKRVVYDAEHFFDGYRDDAALRAALPARGRARPAPRRSCSATPTAARCPRQIAEAIARCRGGARPATRALGIHCHDDAGCGVANTLAGVEAGATHVQGTINGYGERCGNANLVSIIAEPPAQARLSSASTPARLARAHRDRALRRRAAQPHARPRPAVRRQERVRAQGRACTSPACTPTRRRSSTSTRTGSATAASCSSPSCRARARCEARAEPPGSSSTTRRPRGSSSASRSSSTTATTSRPPTARSSCCCARRRASYEPLFRLESWRVIVEKRADGKVETEATIKIWVDGERYVRTAEGNGPVNALDKALRSAIARDPPAPRGHRARQLQGPHPRRDARAPARSRACCSTPPTATTSGARSACPRTSSRPPGRPSSTRWSADAAGGAPRRPGRRAGAGVSDEIPLAQPVLGARGGAGRASRCCAPGSSRSARACRRSRRRSPARLGVAARQRRLERHRGPAPRAARGRA